LSASRRYQLAGYTKMVMESRKRLDSYAIEAAKMGKTRFKLAPSPK